MLGFAETTADDEAQGAVEKAFDLSPRPARRRDDGAFQRRADGSALQSPAAHGAADRRRLPLEWQPTRSRIDLAARFASGRARTDPTTRSWSVAAAIVLAPAAAMPAGITTGRTDRRAGRRAVAAPVPDAAAGTRRSRRCCGTRADVAARSCRNRAPVDVRNRRRAAVVALYAPRGGGTGCRVAGDRCAGAAHRRRRVPPAVDAAIIADRSQVVRTSRRPARSQPSTVMVVDDSPTIRKILGLTLERAG